MIAKYILLIASCLLLCNAGIAQFKPSLLAVIEGGKDGDWFGRWLAGGGDINGDGYDDIGISGAGKIYVYFGSAHFDTLADLILTNKEEVNAEARFSTLAMGGDVNGDGYDDILAANPQTPILTKAYLYLGGSEPDTIPDFTFKSPHWSFGFSLSISGDYNNDGYDDVLLSSNDYGRVYLYLGGAPMDSVADAVFFEGGDLLGGSLASGCDVNGDGFEDIIIGSTHHSYLYFGSDSLDTGADLVFNEGQDVVLGDFNNDSFSDAVTSFGGVYLSSERGIDNVVDIKPEWLGAMATGYFNRDRFIDLVGGNSSAYGGLGAVWVYLGGDPMDNKFDWGGRGTGGGNLGTAVANAGDVNGDSVEDILVSEPNYFYGKMRGRVFVIAGDTSTVTAVASETEYIVRNFILYPNYPNPFNQNTTIKYQIPDGIWPVTLKVINPLGEEVKTIVEKTRRGGNYQGVWDATDRFGKEVSSGVYLLVLQVGDSQRVRKVLLIR